MEVIDLVEGVVCGLEMVIFRFFESFYEGGGIFFWLSVMMR